MDFKLIKDNLRKYILTKPYLRIIFSPIIHVEFLPLFAFCKSKVKEYRNNNKPEFDLIMSDVELDEFLDILLSIADRQYISFIVNINQPAQNSPLINLICTKGIEKEYTISTLQIFILENAPN